MKMISRGFEMISQRQMNKDFETDIEYEIKLPKRSTKESAGYDIFSPVDILLKPNEEIKVPTGLKVHMQKGEVLLIFPRSS